MKLYNALLKKNQEGKIEDIVIFKDGFCWMAFFFSIFWFLYHKMWKEALALVIVDILISILDFQGIVTGSSKILLELLFAVMIAINANYWLVESLKKRGYEFVGLIFGSNMVNAKMRFIKDLESDLDGFEFDDAIINPKTHRRLRKLKKHEHYFVT